MRFVDSSGKPMKVKTRDLTVAFAHRGRCLIVTFMVGDPKQPITPIQPDGTTSMTSDICSLCRTKGEAMAAMIATMKILEFATGHRLIEIGPPNDSINRIYRFTKPRSATKEG